MSAELRKLFQQGSLDTGLPLPPSHLLGPSYLPVYLPPDVCRQKLSPSFLKGYAGVDGMCCWPAVHVQAAAALGVCYYELL